MTATTPLASISSACERPTDVVASVTISHRKVVVHWTSNQTGDASCCPTLDYSVDLTLKGATVLPSHPHTYNDAYVAETLAGRAVIRQPAQVAQRTAT